MAKKRLLVVDDDSQVCDLVNGIFGDEFEVIPAGTGEEAIKHAVLNPPDCILLDIMMPQMGGFLLLEILKSIRQTKLIPVLVVSGKAREESWKIARDMGAFEYVQKPFHIENIRSAVHRALDVAPRERRKSPRVTIGLPILVRWKDSSGKDLEANGLTVNVSRHGTQVELPIEVPAGTEIEINPSQSGGHCLSGEPLRARIIWSVRTSTLGPFHHGIEFASPTSNWIIKA